MMSEKETSQPLQIQKIRLGISYQVSAVFGAVGP